MKILSILSKKSSAFSILELLVAVSVLSILLVVLLNIVQGATSLWRGSENKVEAYREARAALQVISSDLRNTLASTNTNFFRTNISGYPNPTNLTFLATLPLSSQNTNSLGDVCTVGYFLKYDNKSALTNALGRQSYNLYRYFVESNETFTNLTGNSTTAVTASFDTNHCEILARNIIGFKPTYYSVTNGTNFTNWTQSTNTPMPQVLEITITAVNNERTMRFSARNASSKWDEELSPTNTSPDYQKNTKTFTTRIPLNIP